MSILKFFCPLSKTNKRKYWIVLGIREAFHQQTWYSKALVDGSVKRGIGHSDSFQCVSTVSVVQRPVFLAFPLICRADCSTEWSVTGTCCRLWLCSSCFSFFSTWFHFDHDFSLVDTLIYHVIIYKVLLKHNIKYWDISHSFLILSL